MDPLDPSHRRGSGEARPMRRWGLIAIFVVASFLIAWFGQMLLFPLFMVRDLGELGAIPDFWRDFLWALFDGEVSVLWTALIPAILVATQLLFLAPLVRAPRVGGGSHGLRTSAIAAGFIGATLVAALAWAVIEVVWWSEDAVDRNASFFFLLPLACAGPGWVIWSVVLFRRGSPRDPMALDRMFLTLAKGTVLAAVFIVPLDVMVRRKKDCYCATGGFLALCLGAAAALWLLGPFVVLGFSRARRRLARRRLCIGCGYERSPGGGGRCPECGRGWTRRVRRLDEPI